MKTVNRFFCSSIKSRFDRNLSEIVIQLRKEQQTETKTENDFEKGYQGIAAEERHYSTNRKFSIHRFLI